MNIEDQTVKIPLDSQNNSSAHSIKLFAKELWDLKLKRYKVKTEMINEVAHLSFLVRINNDIELETLKDLAFAKFDVPFVLYQDSNGYVTKEINEARML